MILPGLYTRRPGLVPTSAALALSATWTTGPAPMGVFFEATAAGFPVARPLHDLRYRWTFGDAGSWGKVTRLWDRSRNTAYGPWAVHTFESAGTYTVTCEVTDGTTTVSETIDITVVTPETYFGASRIFAVSQAGDFTGAPAGAAQHTDLLAALNASRSNFPNSSPQPRACILLRAGETFDGGDFFERCGFRVRDGFMLT
jgi:PKD repeat protein